MTTYRHVVLASRPHGPVSEDNFRIEEATLPLLKDGEVLVHNHFMSLDPYMRGRMNDAKSYAMPQKLDTTMGGATVGVVVESKSADFKAGDHVRGMLGWAEYGISDSRALSRVDTRQIPLSAYLGVVGMPGMTAWYGLNKIIEPKAGETVVVSAASGAVGSAVGQLAKLAGARVVGIAGGPEKCRYVTDELGFDACIDYRTADDARAMSKLIREAAPKGVDGHFENGGGDVLNGVMTRLNPFARVAICGLISDYNALPGEAMKSAITNPSMFLVARFKMQGFIVSDHLDLWPEGLSELGRHVASGKVKYRETIADGLEQAPSAFIGMLAGKNFGKQLVRLA
jgi:NADPH-dependent curcumin reductase CurA